MNIAVIGVGGVGGYFGSKLALSKAEKDNVYFIARGEHLEKINEKGLIVKSEQEGESACHPTLATNQIAQLPLLDVCLICVKAYDLDSVLLQLKDKIKDTTQIIPLLNGINIYEKVRKVIKNGFVYPACVYIGTYISEPGVICHNKGQCKIIFGKDYEKPESDAKMVREVFSKANIDYLWTESYREEIWGKYMCIAPYALVTAAYNKTMWEVYDDRNLSEKVLGIMKVIFELSKKKGINLSEDCIQKSYNVAANYPHDLKTSFQRDYEKKRACDERESFGGVIITMCKEYGIDCTIVEEVYGML